MTYKKYELLKDAYLLPNMSVRDQLIEMFKGAPDIQVPKTSKASLILEVKEESTNVFDHIMDSDALEEKGNKMRDQYRIYTDGHGFRVKYKFLCFWLWDKTVYQGGGYGPAWYDTKEEAEKSIQRDIQRKKEQEKIHPWREVK